MKRIKRIFNKIIIAIIITIVIILLYKYLQLLSTIDNSVSKMSYTQNECYKIYQENK